MHFQNQIQNQDLFIPIKELANRNEANLILIINETFLLLLLLLFFIK